MKTETYFVWKELAQVGDEKEPRLVTPWADPQIYEFPFDFLYKTPEDAVEGLKDWTAVDDARETPWILCKETLEPLTTQPNLANVDSYVD